MIPRGFPLVLALLVGTAAVAAQAREDTRASHADPQMRWIAYDPMQVTRVQGTPLSSTQIMFAKDERILQVALGDSDAWLAQPFENLLFIKPVEVRSTNGQVVTRRANGELRTYQFEFAALPQPSVGNTNLAAYSNAANPNGAAFGVVFTYPEDDREAARKKAQESQEQAGERVAESRLVTDAFAGPRNWEYTACGSKETEPAEVSDNGQSTAFRFPGNTQTPAIYAVEPGKTPARVPSHAQDDLVIVDQVAQKFILVYGKSQTCVNNKHYVAAGYDPRTGTTSPEVVRVVHDPHGAP